MIQQKQYHISFYAGLSRSRTPRASISKPNSFLQQILSANPFFFSPWFTCDHDCDPVLMIWVLIRSLETSGYEDSEGFPFFAHHKYHRTTNCRTCEEWWIYGLHSFHRSTMDRSFRDSGFGGFQSTFQQISWSVELVNSQSKVDQRSTTSQHPTTNTHYRTPIF
jgi:hypothetical protein